MLTYKDKQCQSDDSHIQERPWQPCKPSREHQHHQRCRNRFGGFRYRCSTNKWYKVLFVDRQTLTNTLDNENTFFLGISAAIVMCVMYRRKETATEFSTFLAFKCACCWDKVLSWSHDVKDAPNPFKPMIWSVEKGKTKWQPVIYPPSTSMTMLPLPYCLCSTVNFKITGVSCMVLCSERQCVLFTCTLI